MIITVTLNAAIDKTLAVPNFQIGRRHRSSEQRTMAGGKGVNVARALKTLGQPVIATGLAGGPTGTRIIEQLTGEAILCDFVRIGDESRTSTAVIDPTSGVQTEVNELGPEVTEAEISLFGDKLIYLAKGADICVFAGSLPRGVDDKIYAELIAELKRLGVMTVIDTEGEPMDLALRAGSRPGVAQLQGGGAAGRATSSATTRTTSSRCTRSASAARARRSSPTRRAATPSSAAITSARCTSCAPSTLEPVSAIGAGDAFLAGYLAARYTGRPHQDALRFAVACGAESTQHLGAGVLDPRAAERLEHEVVLTELDEPAPSTRTPDRIRPGSPATSALSVRVRRPSRRLKRQCRW